MINAAVSLQGGACTVLATAYRVAAVSEMAPDALLPTVLHAVLDGGCYAHCQLWVTLQTVDIVPRFAI